MANSYLKSPIKRDLLFLGILLLISLFYDYQNILFYRPQGIHAWRQTDCLSLTYSYYKENAPFLEPQLHIQFSDQQTSGKTIGEFPILYYFIGNLWKLFGHQEYMYRLFVLLLSYLGLFYLYRIAWKLTNSWMLAVSAPIILLSSPIFAFYAANFLTNIPALSTMLIGWYFIARYIENARMKHFYWAIFFFLLTGLLKVSTLMTVMLIPLAILLEMIGLHKLKKEGKAFAKPVLQLGLFVFMLALVMGWYKYADYYMSIHEGRYTFTKPVTLWETPRELSDMYLTHFKESLLPQIHRVVTMALIIIAGIFLFIRHRKVEKFWLIGIPILLVGYVFFVLLFIYSLDGHDYYHIDFLAVLIFIYLAFIRYISREESVLIQSPMAQGIFSIFLVFNVMGCANNLYVRYHNCPESDLPYRQIFCSRKEVDLLGYPQWQSDIMRTYGTVEPTLRKAGISREDRFLTMDDGSFNVTLYLMDQKGWPNMDGSLGDSLKIMDKVQLGAKFMIMHRPETLEQAWLKPFMSHPFLQYENLHVFDLRPFAAVKQSS